jgi:hypothetical protein
MRLRSCFSIMRLPDLYAYLFFWSDQIKELELLLCVRGGGHPRVN